MAAAPAVWELCPLAPRPAAAAVAGASSHATTAAGSLLVGRGRKAQAPSGPSRAEIYTRIVPDLLALAARDDDARVVNAALMALGRAIDPPFHDPLLEVMPALLSRNELTVQRAATLALGLSASHDGTEMLISLMSCSGDGQRLVQASFAPAQVRAGEGRLHAALRPAQPGPHRRC